MKFDLLKQYASDNDISLDDNQISQLERFSDLLVEKNKVMNLTSITDPGQVEIKHMIDSLAAVNVIKDLVPCDFSLLDVGCGAGFPGIPLKIAFPENRFVLLDSLNKRINFVREVSDTLELRGLEAVAVRAEDFSQRESFDICTSRAVASMNVLLEYSLPFVKIGGYCILYKSADYEKELAESQNAINVLGGEYHDTYTFNLPYDSGSRSLVIIRKISETPAKYPRRAGKPSKNPL